jgi:hypothetical protein
MISREQLLSQTATRYVDKVVFGETYRIRSLSERERAEYEIKLQDKKAGMSLNKARALLICRVLVDETNSRLLTDDDTEAVGRIDGRIASALYSIALEHNGFAEDDIKDLVKNSEGAAG